MVLSGYWKSHRRYSVLWCLLIAVAAQALSQGHAPKSEDDHHRDGEGHHHGHGGDGRGFHHDFSDAEHWSKRFDGEERDEWQKPAEVIRLMEIEAGMTVADLGAGTGYFLESLSRAVGLKGRVLALDPEPGMVAFMKDRVEKNGWRNVEVRQIPFDDPELEEGAVDRLLIVNTWHHIDARGAYAAKILATLAEDGAVFVVDFDKDSPSGPPKQHRLPPEQIVRELSEGGLEAVRVEEGLPRQFVVVGSKGSTGD